MAAPLERIDQADPSPYKRFERMNSGDLTLLLDRLLVQAGEHEWLEFKHNDDPHTMGEYVSALANAAALDGEPFGYMVWALKTTPAK